MSRLDNLVSQLSHYDDLLFDMDNTLFSMEDYDRGAFSDIADAYPSACGLAKFLLQLKRLKGPHYGRLFDDAESYYCLPHGAVSKMISIYHEHDARYVDIDSDYLDLLHQLRREGHRLFLITNGRLAIQQRKIAKLSFDNLFTKCVICDGSYERPLKPDPATFIWLDKKYSFNRPVMIGDTLDIDEQYARRCGIAFIYHCYGKE